VWQGAPTRAACVAAIEEHVRKEKKETKWE